MRPQRAPSATAAPSQGPAKARDAAFRAPSRPHATTGRANQAGAPLLVRGLGTRGLGTGAGPCEPALGAFALFLLVVGGGWLGSALRGIAAIDRNGRSCHEVRRRARKKDGNAAHVVGRAPASR